MEQPPDKSYFYKKKLKQIYEKANLKVLA